jgi:UDP-N-acetylglucosamine:LPS N-acetylglucosamine transferase
LNCTPHNPDELAKLIVELASNSQKRKIMSENAQRLGHDKFDRYKTYMELVSLINELI